MSLETSRKRNLQAQKRYRDRQKEKLGGLEDQMAVLTNRISELQTVHDSLEARNKSLQRFSELQEASDSREPSASGSNENNEEGEGWDSEKSKWLAENMAQIFNLLRRPEESKLTAKDCKYLCTESDRFLALRLDFLARLWDTAGRTLDPSPKARQNVVDVIKQLTQLRLAMVQVMTPQHEPPSAWVIKQRMATVQVENSLKVGEALPTLCKNMDLSQTQIDSLIGARQIFNKKIDSIRERRTSILERINECDSRKLDHSLEMAFDSLQQSAEVQLKLQESLVEEGKCISEYGVLCLKEIEPWQEARMMLDGYHNFGVVVDSWEAASYFEFQHRQERAESLESKA